MTRLKDDDAKLRLLEAAIKGSFDYIRLICAKQNTGAQDITKTVTDAENALLQRLVYDLEKKGKRDGNNIITNDV